MAILEVWLIVMIAKVFALGEASIWLAFLLLEYKAWWLRRKFNYLHLGFDFTLGGHA